MSDNKSQPLSVELIANCINDVAREIGVMDPDDQDGRQSLKNCLC